MFTLYEPQKHIIYQSQAQQAADEFWWAEGAIATTRAGDFLLIGIVLAATIVYGLQCYTNVTGNVRSYRTKNYQWMELLRKFHHTLFFLVLTGILVKLLWMCYNRW